MTLDLVCLESEDVEVKTYTGYYLLKVETNLGIGFDGKSVIHIIFHPSTHPPIRQDSTHHHDHFHLALKKK
jgi:hypothetical protein